MRLFFRTFGGLDMGWQVYSRTNIWGSEKAIKQIEELISSPEALEAKFPCVATFGLPYVSYKTDRDNNPCGYIQVVFDTRKEVPEDLFGWCESLECHIDAVSNCEGDREEEHYDSETIKEDRQYKLEQLEQRLEAQKEKLTEAQAEEEMGIGVQNNSNGGVTFTAADMAKAMVQTTEGNIARLRQQIAGDIWTQALED